MKKLKALVAVGATVAMLGSAQHAEAQPGVAYGSNGVALATASIVTVAFVGTAIVVTNNSKGTGNH